RVHYRRVVEQHDPHVAVDDRLQPARERLRLDARLGVDLAQKRFSEVGQRRARKAADEALGPDDAELELLYFAGRAVAVEEADTGGAENLLELASALSVVIVVAEDGEDRDVERPACRGEHLGLLRLATRGQVPGEENDVRLAPELGKGSLDAFGTHVRGVDVCRCSNADHLAHVAETDKPETTCRCPSPRS